MVSPHPCHATPFVHLVKGIDIFIWTMFLLAAALMEAGEKRLPKLSESSAIALFAGTKWKLATTFRLPPKVNCSYLFLTQALQFF
jgi:hypothetical protein